MDVDVAASYAAVLMYQQLAQSPESEPVTCTLIAVGLRADPNPVHITNEPGAILVQFVRQLSMFPTPEGEAAFPIVAVIEARILLLNVGRFVPCKTCPTVSPEGQLLEQVIRPEATEAENVCCGA